MIDDAAHETGELALVTGASLGLGADLSAALVATGWSVVVDARDPGHLAAHRRRLEGLAPPGTTVEAVVGDVADPEHRAALGAAVAAHGRLDLLVNNASVLGPSPQPALVDYPLDAFRQVLEVNTVAPLALAQVMTPWLARSRRPRILNITSDAAVVPYERWGGYGTSKAALERISGGWSAENPSITVWALDPGDLRTRLHAQACPGEDISDRPAPASVVPAIVRLINSDTFSGRFSVNEFLAEAVR